MISKLVHLSYKNPIINDDFPDPRVIEVKGQGYFAYGTHDEFSPTINNILLRHSWDLIHWSEAEGALLKLPVWAKHCKKFWCPHVALVSEEFRLYYAAEPDTKDGMCLALATSNDTRNFIDCGHPIAQKRGSTFELLDPCFFIDPISKKHLLFYGSAHEPIRVVELASDGQTFITSPKNILLPGETTYHKLREGAYVTYNEKWKRYFLWVSGDNTWASCSYAVSVFWSESAIGEFEKIPGDHVVLKANDHWDSPGHNCIIKDTNHSEWIIYHAVDVKDRFIPGTDRFLRKMCIDEVLYTEDGWPYINTRSPSYSVKNGPAVRYDAVKNYSSNTGFS